MPLIAAIYFWMEELLPKINDFQKRTGLHKVLPEKFEDYDYYDQMFMEEYLCNNTRVFIKEYKYVDVIGFEPYNYVFLFDWKCQMMPWANNRIRLNYYIGLHDHNMKGVFYNESVHNYQSFDKYYGGVQAPNLFDNVTEKPVEIIDYFSLRKEISYFSAIYCKYSEELKGLNNLLFIFTTEKFQNKTEYNNWNFTTPTLWDEFWFDPTTQRIYKSPTFHIGTEELEESGIRTRSAKYTYKNGKVHKKFLGIATETSDKIEVYLNYDSPLSVDADGQTKIKLSFNTSDVKIPIDFNYVQT